MSAKYVALVAFVALFAFVASEARAEPYDPSGSMSRQGLGLDLEVAGGVRLHADGASRAWFARARVGVLAFTEPSFWSLGVAGQLGPLASSSLGAELSYTEVFHGASGQVGIFPIDSVGGTIVEAQLGWAVFGVEYQRRIAGPRDNDQAFVFTVHVPIGLIYQMLQPPPGVVEH